MKLSISEIAALSGVSVRTLHYYDEIGLLKPREVSQSGYRYYDRESLETLQLILFYKELQFSLKDISNIMTQPQYDRKQALRKQKELLILKEILQCLGQMYINDERFKENIDKNGKGTAEFMAEAIAIYCSK